MTAYDWLESHKVIRFAALTVLFLIASEALFGTVTVWILAGLPGRPGVFGDVVLPLATLSIALGCSLALARIVHRPHQRRFISTFATVLAAVFLGMVLVSVATIRENWLEYMKELFLHGPVFLRRG